MLPKRTISTDNNHLHRPQRADQADFRPIDYLQWPSAAVVPVGDMLGSPDWALSRPSMGKELDVVLVVDSLALDVAEAAHIAAAVAVGVVVAKAPDSAL